jgi:steroid 5-alpha reductase family enzyme
MIENLLIINTVILFIYMTLGFALARQRQHLDTVDAAWGLGFVLVAWAVELQAPSLRSLVVALLVSIWGLRLSSHIWRRNQGRDDDPRYRELTAQWRGNIWAQAYLRIFLLQGVLIWLVSLPVVMTAGQQLSGRGWLTLVGALVWLVGFSFEATADRQLRQFLASKNHPKLLQTGLWRYSRHPNYFGELVQWWGLGLIALQTSFGWIGLLGPALLSYLIIFVSGLPPIERRHQHDPLYQAYRSRTSALIPWPPSEQDA